MCHSGGQFPEAPRMGLGGNLMMSLDEEAQIVEHEQTFLTLGLSEEMWKDGSRHPGSNMQIQTLSKVNC